MDPSHTTQGAPQASDSSSDPRCRVPESKGEALRERVAWLACGVALALVASVVLGPALAGTAQETRTPRPIAQQSAGMSADSNNRMIAVTGVDITGQSVLYLVDTVSKQLAVYQASGGAAGTHSIKLVGARRIDLDLQLEGLNDKTEVDGKSLSYSELRATFEREVDDE